MLTISKAEIQKLTKTSKDEIGKKIEKAKAEFEIFLENEIKNSASAGNDRVIIYPYSTNQIGSIASQSPEYLRQMDSMIRDEAQRLSELGFGLSKHTKKEERFGLEYVYYIRISWDPNDEELA